MSMYHELLAMKIKTLEQANIIIRLIGNPKGFYNLYSCSLWKFKTKKECFEYCNQYYKDFFGSFLYSDFEEFQKENQLKPEVPQTAHEILEREYLISWFKSKGFNSFTAFKAIVLHYYPEIYEETLFVFWNYKSDSEVAKYVNYVKQIIGE